MASVSLPYQWRPRNYQLPFWCHMERPKPNLRACCVWHRRAGKDLCAINLIATKSQERVGTYWHMLPSYKQARNIVWNGHTKDGRSFLSHFPQEILEGKPNSTEMRVKFRNGSLYQLVGTDNINSLVGTNPIGVVFSEYSLHDPAAWDYIRPILLENDGWAVFIYTARGKNHGHRLLTMAKQNPEWFCQVLGAGDRGTLREDGTPVISDAAIDSERRAGMPEEMIQQEFYCSFEAPLVGAYYSSQMMWLEKQRSELLGPDGEPLCLRFANIPWEPKLLVDTWWDIGYDDSTTIWFVQRYGQEYRCIDYYENSGEALPHYIKILREKEYAYGEHLGPHDLEVHEFQSGKTRKQAAKDLGLRFRVVKKHMIEDGIEAVRSFLPGCWLDQVKCARGIAALREYKKEWDEDKKVFKNQPLHDWASHGADAFRTGVMGTKARAKTSRRLDKAIDDHDYLSNST